MNASDRITSKPRTLSDYISKSMQSRVDQKQAAVAYEDQRFGTLTPHDGANASHENFASTRPHISTPASGLQGKPLPMAPSTPGQDFSYLLEKKVPAGEEPNAWIVKLFNQGKTTEEGVLRATTSCIRHASDWTSVAACLDALKRCNRSGHRVFPNLISFSAAMTMCDKNGHFDKALALFDHLVQHGPGFAIPAYPNTYLYNTAILSCEKTGQHHRAPELLYDLFDRGGSFPVPAHPDTISYTSAIKACAKGKMPDKAWELFNHLLRHGPDMPVPTYPSTMTYNATMTACERASRPDDALELLDHLRTHGPHFPVPALPDVTSYTLPIQAYEQAGQTDKALELFDDLVEHGPSLAPPVHPNVITYNAAVGAAVKAGLADRYRALLRLGIDGFPGQPDTKVFHPNLGFDPLENKLDLHKGSVLTQHGAADDPGSAVAVAVTRAIFESLLLSPQEFLPDGVPGINRQTMFVVGQHGEGKIRDAISNCIRAQGWIPTHPIQHNNRPNYGRLQALPGPVQQAPHEQGNSVPNSLAGAFVEEQASALQPMAQVFTPRLPSTLRPDAREFVPANL